MCVCVCVYVCVCVCMQAEPQFVWIFNVSLMTAGPGICKLNITWISDPGSSDWVSAQRCLSSQDLCRLGGLSYTHTHTHTKANKTPWCFSSPASPWKPIFWRSTGTGYIFACVCVCVCVSLQIPQDHARQPTVRDIRRVAYLGKSQVAHWLQQPKQLSTFWNKREIIYELQVSNKDRLQRMHFKH